MLSVAKRDRRPLSGRPPGYGYPALSRADLADLAPDGHEWPMAGPGLNRTGMDS